ncbi:MAG: AAA family ATPase [Acidobacteriota bacterium]
MQGNNQLPGLFSAAVLTVCVDPKTAEQFVEAVEHMPWLVSSSCFESYVSANRRPYMGPQIKSANICIALVDFDHDVAQAVESIKYLQALFAGRLTVIALSDNKNPELLLMAMRAGCSEFLAKPFEQRAVSETLKRLEQTVATPQTRNTPMGSVISFFGAKGGVGSTTLAVHLAMYLVQCHDKRTLLIDSHPELGHVCVYLGIDGTRYNFNEVVRNVSRLDSELLRGFVAKHQSGLEVLSSPDLVGGGKFLDGESVTKTLEFLRSEYDYVIVDCSTQLDEANLAVIDASTRVYLVATPEIGAIRDLSRYVDNLMQIEYTTEKMHVVINRFSSRYAVNVEQIEKAIRLPVAIKLPNNYTELVRSVNLGEPVPPNRKNDFTLQFTKWANTLVGSTAPAPVAKKESSRFAMWK